MVSELPGQSILEKDEGLAYIVIFRGTTMVFKKAISSYILAQTMTMSLDKIQSRCCPISLIAFIFQS